VNMKNALFWDLTPCGSCKNSVSEEIIASIIMMEALRSSEIYAYVGC
jgi:acid phosphatase class B